MALSYSLEGSLSSLPRKSQGYPLSRKRPTTPAVSEQQSMRTAKKAGHQNPDMRHPDMRRRGGEANRGEDHFQIAPHWPMEAPC